MATEGFMVFQKRGDGKAFADLHKSTGIIRTDAEAAERDLAADPYRDFRQVVRVVVMTEAEYLHLTKDGVSDFRRVAQEREEVDLFLDSADFYLEEQTGKCLRDTLSAERLAELKADWMERL